MSILRDGAAAVVQMEAGALDLVFDPPAQDVSRLSSDARYGVYVNDKSGISGVMNMNSTVPPTNNKVFRQAIHFALDRDRYVQTVLRGRGEARSLPWTSASPAYDPARSKFFTHDLAFLFELRREWFKGDERVGIATGASTPGFLADQVVAKLQEWFPGAEAQAIANTPVEAGAGAD